jgi:C4-dicarboxylate-binding protein DctP
MSKLEPKGIIGLAFWDNGFKVMTDNKPLREPADFRGQKMRIQSSKVLDAQFRALGAIPQVMAFSEVYQAMQTGVVDGSENTPSNVYTQRMHEVQKYLTVSNHGYIGYAVIVNKKFWEGLPADIRKTLEGAMHDATIYANDIAKKENDDALQKIKDAHTTEIIELTAQQKADWKKTLAKVHRQQEGRIGKDLIQQVYQATGKSM